MKRPDLKTFFIVVLAGLFAWLAAEKAVRAGGDGGGGDADRGIIAVTGTYGSGASALYLFDTRTRHLAVYRLENGRALEFVAARDCSYDFFIETYNDQSSSGMMPARLRQGWQEFNRRGATTVPSAESQSGMPPAAERGEEPLPANPPPGETGGGREASGAQKRNG